MHKIFISYKRKNKDKVFKIVNYIESQLATKCWVDLDGIESSRQFASIICKAIDSAEVILFMHSSCHLNIDFENDWTIKELNYANAKGKRVVLIKIDDAPLDNIFLMEYGSKNNIDANDEAQLNKLISDLRKWLKLPSNSQTKNLSTSGATKQNVYSNIDEVKKTSLLNKSTECNPEELKLCQDYIDKYIKRDRLSTEESIRMEKEIRDMAQIGKTEAEYTLGFSDYYNNRRANKLKLEAYLIAESWLTKAAKKGHVKAMASLADMYYRTKEIEKAIPYAIEASKKNNLDATLTLAMCYLSLGRDKEYFEATKRAAELQKIQKDKTIHCPAEEYGKMLMENRYTKMDLTEAIKWFDVAIELSYDSQERAYSQYWKAKALYKQGHKYKAIKCLSEIPDHYFHICDSFYKQIKSELNPALRILF